MSKALQVDHVPALIRIKRSPDDAIAERAVVERVAGVTIAVDGRIEHERAGDTLYAAADFFRPVVDRK